MLARWREYGTLPLRIGLGGLALTLAAQKLMSGGPYANGVAQTFESMGFTPGGFWALVAAAVEIGGGAALIAGALTPAAAAALAVERIVALVAYGLAGQAASPDVALSVAMLAGFASLVVWGAGAFGLDAWLAQYRWFKPFLQRQTQGV